MAPISITVPISSPTKMGASVGIECSTGRVCWRARAPASASTGTMIANRPSAIAAPPTRS